MNAPGFHPLSWMAQAKADVSLFPSLFQRLQRIQPDLQLFERFSLNDCVLITVAVTQLGDEMRRVCMGDIESIVDKRLLFDLCLINLIRLVECRFIKRYITSPYDFALTWDPDEVDICAVISNQKSNMCSRLKLVKLWYVFVQCICFAAIYTKMSKMRNDACCCLKRCLPGEFVLRRTIHDVDCGFDNPGP